jgi:hypothetical protein
VKKIVFPLLFLITTTSVESQTDGLVVNSKPGGFFVDGYLLYNKDSTRCRLWFYPGNFNFEDSLLVWLNEKPKTIPLAKNDSLVGFGITQQGYRMHFGKLRLQGLKSHIYTFAKKLVTGPVELYEFPVTVTRKDPHSFGLIHETFSDYYLARSDDKKFSFPVFIKQLKKKKIAEFLTGFPGLKKFEKDSLTPEETVDVVQQYNEWLASQKAGSN